MYDELIIEYIKKKREQEQEQRPYLELPIPECPERIVSPEQPEPKRVIIIDLNSDENK